MNPAHPPAMSLHLQRTCPFLGNLDSIGVHRPRSKQPQTICSFRRLQPRCLFGSARPGSQHISRIALQTRPHQKLKVEVRTASTDGSSASTPEGAAKKEVRQRPEELPPTSMGGASLQPFHFIAFAAVLAGGLLFLALFLYSSGDIEFKRAVAKVFKRLMKTVALRQVIGILSAMAFVRYGLEPLVKNLRQVFKGQGAWEKSSEYYILREVYKPLEFLFAVAAFTTLAENFLPQLIAIPKSIVQTVVRSTLSLTFVIAAARVVFNIKGRIMRETTWQLELKGDITRQRRFEAVDKLLSVLTLIVGSVFGLQALGLDVNSVLAIGGVGGLAVGLAGREILENLFTGLIILSSNPFEVGDEVLFRPVSGQVVEGIVVDVGWYRTTIRSFEREIFNIPNSVFSRNVVLNITRKNKEWRFFEFIYLRIEDLPKVGAVVADMRKIIRADPRIIQKLHRRVFLDKITREDASLYVSFYCEATNRDAFMAIKQDLYLAFVDCVDRNGARLSRNRLQLEVLPNYVSTSSGPKPGEDAPSTDPDQKALPSAVDVTATSTSSVTSPNPSSSNGGGTGPTSMNGGGGSSTQAGGSTQGQPKPSQQQQTPPSAPPKSGSAGAASNIVPTGSSSAGSSGLGTSSSGGAVPVGAGVGAGRTSASMESSGSLSDEMVSDPAATMMRLAAAMQSGAVSPDRIINNTQDQGLYITGSFDEPYQGSQPL